MGVSVVKKFAAALTVALVSYVVAPAFVAPAHADQHNDPYTAGVRTSCNVTVPAVIKRGSAPRIRVDVRPNSPAQGANPRGNVRVTISQAGTRIFTRTVSYRGSAIVVTGPTLTQTGRYQVRTHFETADGSAFRSCNGSAAFDIRSGQGPDDETTGPQGGDNPAGGLLPDTGGPHLTWLLLGLALLGTGGGLVYGARRRPRAPLYDV
jgi:hypothetical protein